MLVYGYHTGPCTDLLHQCECKPVLPVRHLLQVHFLLALNKLSDVMTQDADEERDEDDG